MFQIGNERVALVTDTSCDLSDEQLSQYDIRTVALRVATSQGEFRDRLEITQEQLYDLLQREVPKTSLPLPEDVSNLYRTCMTRVQRASCTCPSAAACPERSTWSPCLRRTLRT